MQRGGRGKEEEEGQGQERRQGLEEEGVLLVVEAQVQKVIWRVILAALIPARPSSRLGFVTLYIRMHARSIRSSSQHNLRWRPCSARQRVCRAFVSSEESLSKRSA